MSTSPTFSVDSSQRGVEMLDVETPKHTRLDSCIGYVNFLQKTTWLGQPLHWVKEADRLMVLGHNALNTHADNFAFYAKQSQAWYKTLGWRVAQVITKGLEYITIFVNLVIDALLVCTLGVIGLLGGSAEHGVKYARNRGLSEENTTLYRTDIERTTFADEKPKKSYVKEKLGPHLPESKRLERLGSSELTRSDSRSSTPVDFLGSSELEHKANESETRE